MSFADVDHLELQHLAGGNIVEHPPVFSAQGRFVFVRCGLKVQVFVTSTGELTRELDDATEPLISLEVDLRQPELLIGCTTSGQLLRWHWRTGVLQKTLKMQLGDEATQILTCNLLDIYRGSDSACAFVTAKRKSGQSVAWFMVDTSTGEQYSVNCGLSLKIRTPLVDVCKGAFKYIILAQGFYLYFINYKTWKFWRFRNSNFVPITCVRLCPGVELAASGDQMGRIHLWRLFDRQDTVFSAICHWHHTPVTSIAFSPSGTSFYSAGREAVLVKWNAERPDERNFVPRMSSIIRHIEISDGNEHILVCTEDNAMQFLSAQEFEVKSALQHFTYGLRDKTGKNLFPIGLRLNPRTNTLVLNGRTGHLQFYSAYTKNLLYNLRVVQSNQQCPEADKLIYNTRVTRAAFNIDWMATGEVYNDQENFAEVRLKFWKFNEKLQSYNLNTDINLPHEHGFKVIVFSNQFKVDNLRCATAGKDNIIKLWSMSASENIYRPGHTWNCIAQTSYKQMTIGSICFAEDGSLLAAGYGNTLVLYDGRSLLQLQALSCPAGYDGVLAKAQLRLSKTLVNGTRKELSQQRQQLMAILKTLLNSNDAELIEQAKTLINASPKITAERLEVPEDTRKESVYKYIMKMSELSLHQKLQLLRRFDIQCSVSETHRNRLVEHLQRCLAPSQRIKEMDARLLRLQQRHRFKAKHQLDQLIRRRQKYEKVVKQDLLPLFSTLQLDEHSKAKTAKPSQPPASQTQKGKAPKVPPAPLQGLAQISHVQFGAGAQAHLVAICTESRVIIWNLMTLRVQAGLKLSVTQLAFDPLTNLIAVITKNDELHVFQLNVPLPIYQRSNIPKTSGLVWLPRRQPRQSSINLDWQAQSTLLMLTENQEIVYFAEPGQSPSDDAPAPISFGSAASGTESQLKHATFGSYLIKQQASSNSTDAANGKKSGPLIVGRGTHSAVNALVNLSAHTMPAMSLICNEFIKSLLTPADSLDTRLNGNDADAGLTNGKLNGNGLAHSDESDAEDAQDEEQQQEQESLRVRKTLLEQNAKLDERQLGLEGDHLELDAKLKRIAALDIHLQF
ncbi:WD repeat-containing protein 75 [Drosophila tropicalis]|uniref:WD repeat-containing protein 75 n=1 Tax=Drosophila tropicalis TaxID=46794 RepID=UPI0035ABDF68